HPQVGTAHGNLALNLSAAGRHAAAESHYRTALDLHTTARGDQSPEAVVTLVNLASNLMAQGKAADARRLLDRAAAAYEATRLVVAGTGLDRAAFGDR